MTHARLGKLLRDGRYGAGLSGDQAATLLGFSSGAHLYKVEAGHMGVKAPKLKRACELYNIQQEEAVVAATRDFREALRKALK